MNKIRSTIVFIAAIAISVPFFSAYAQNDPRLSGAAQMAAKRAKAGQTAIVDKSSNGELFEFVGYLKGILPDDIYFVDPAVDSVGVKCDENGKQIDSGISRCKRFHSDSKNVTFMVRFARDKDRTFFFDKKSNGQVELVPYTEYDRGKQTTTFMSGRAEQFASAHGLAIKASVASSSQPEVVAAPTKCDNLFEPLKRACLGVLAANKKPVTIDPAVMGGILGAAKK